jgi:hypothetical protein
MKKHTYTALLTLALSLALCSIAAVDFSKMHKPDILYPSPALTQKIKLSAYLPRIQNTNGDADVYIFDSGLPGATVLILGGTHPNEAAGFMAATLLLENIKVEAGRFIIIPQACSSGFTCTDPLEAYPEYYTIKTAAGERQFRFGSRVSNPLDQWPDPLVYAHYPSGQSLSGFESRNLNRSYPGREDGSLSEQTANAIMKCIEAENVDVAFDLHEAAPEIPIINAIVVHEKARDIGASAILDLEIDGLTYALEPSPVNFHGLSHREWGDSTNAIPFLMETSNPIQGRLRGKTSAELILNGNDQFYAKALTTAHFRITYDDKNGYPLKVRVARHLRGIKAILTGYNDAHPEKPVRYSDIPQYDELVTNGIGKYLK